MESCLAHKKNEQPFYPGSSRMYTTGLASPLTSHRRASSICGSVLRRPYPLRGITPTICPVLKNFLYLHS